jgi:hypothetical protein
MILRVGFLFTGAVLFGAAVFAQSITVPNHSFESPDTEFAFPQVDSWQRSPKPAWFQETPEQQWIFLTGVFENTAPGTSDHISNIDGEQALFMFAQPDVAIFQDYTTIGGTNSAPTMEFDAQFQPGRAYQLTAGVIGGGGGMVEGVTLELSLYYRDANSNIVTVAATTITNTAANFPNQTNFVDFHVMSPLVSASDAFQSNHIGIRIASTATFQNGGGYWDVDNIRLTEVATPGPQLTIVRSGANGTNSANVLVTWAALQGRTYQVQTSENFTNWTNVGAPQPGLGKDATAELPIENVGAKFIQVVETATP